MANQFTRAEEEGLPKPPGANHFTTGKRQGHDEQTKAKIRAAFAADKLEAYLNGDVTLEAAQVTAARALMDKGLPSLQAIEATEVNQFDKMSEEEILEQVRALINLHPGLIERLGIKPQLVDTASHNTHESCTKVA